MRLLLAWGKWCNEPSSLSHWLREDSPSSEPEVQLAHSDSSKFHPTCPPPLQYHCFCCIHAVRGEDKGEGSLGCECITSLILLFEGCLLNAAKLIMQSPEAPDTLKGTVGVDSCPSSEWPLPEFCASISKGQNCAWHKCILIPLRPLAFFKF